MVHYSNIPYMDMYTCILIIMLFEINVVDVLKWLYISESEEEDEEEDDDNEGDKKQDSEQEVSVCNINFCFSYWSHFYRETKLRRREKLKNFVTSLILAKEHRNPTIILLE